MNLKRLSALGLAACLAASMTLPAMAIDMNMPIMPVPDQGVTNPDIDLGMLELDTPIMSVPDIDLGILPVGEFKVPVDLPEEVNVPIGDRYTASITVNGKALDEVTFFNYDPETYEETEVTMSMADIPGAPTGYVPMRMLCAADPNGYTSWISSENAAVFSFHKNSFTVSFDDLSIKVDDETVEGARAYLDHDGVTFVPVSFLATLPGVEVDDHPEMSSEHYDFTLKVSALETLATAIKDEAGCSANMEETDKEVLEMVLELPEGTLEDAIAYFGMNTSADTFFLLKAPEDQHDAVKEALEARRQQQEDTFTWYLPGSGNLEKAQDGQVVSAGEYVMLFIGEDAVKAVELFTAGTAEL